MTYTFAGRRSIEGEYLTILLRKAVSENKESLQTNLGMTAKSPMF
jgi:hypothetical protein